MPEKDYELERLRAEMDAAQREIDSAKSRLDTISSRRSSIKDQIESVNYRIADIKWHEKCCARCGAIIRYHEEWTHIPALCKSCKANRSN